MSWPVAVMIFLLVVGLPGACLFQQLRDDLMRRVQMRGTGTVSHRIDEPKRHDPGQLAYVTRRKRPGATMIVRVIATTAEQMSG